MKKISYLKVAIYALVLDWVYVAFCFSFGLFREYLKGESRQKATFIIEIAADFLNWFHGFMARVFFREFFPVLTVSEGNYFVPSYGELFLFHLFCAIQTVVIALMIAACVNWLHSACTKWLK
jgi:hypothetical protein